MIRTVNKWWTNKSYVVRTLWILLLFGFISRLMVSPYGIFTNDFQEDLRRAEVLVENGMSSFYRSGASDKLPGGRLYMSWALGQVKKIMNDQSDELLYKLPANISDVVLSLFLFSLVRLKWGEEKGLIASLMYFYNPFVWHISALWGQTDSVQVLLLLVVLLVLFKSWYGAVAIVMVFAFQFKPHSIFLAPLILLYLWQKRKSRKQFLKNILIILTISLGVVWVLSVPFVPNNHSPEADLDKLLSPWKLTWQQFELAKDTYPFSSVNAFNLWGFLRSSWESDGQSWLGLAYKRWGLLFFSASVLVVIRWLWKKGTQPVLEDYGFALALIFLFGFTFLTRVHERYLLPFFFFFLFSVWSFSSRLWTYLLLTILAVANSWYAYGWLSGKPWVEPNGPMMSLLSLGVVLITFVELIKLNGLFKGGRKSLEDDDGL